ncbi:MAG: hypothetical protein RL118_466 [Actinomycetota bacterium]|jgi:CobQ-like glutamine amidotransferase family enzyme
MTAMHNILVLYPEHLNLNGDVANAGVLARRMNWYGIDAAIDLYYPGDVLPGHQPDFVLLGHGSVAAWKSIDDDFKRVFPVLQAWVAAGVFGLAVNSGQELLHKAPTKIFAQTLTEGERVSEFVVSEVAWLGDGARLLGYQNSVFDTPLVERVNNFVGTQLHGPVLSKNAALADWFIKGIAGVEDLPADGAGVPHLEYVKQHEEKIWQLEDGSNH